MRRIVALGVVLLFACSLFAQSYRIYGGKDYEDYLGKWAIPYDSESIWNRHSTYGSKYGGKSIWNKYGPYGNPYNPYSPWNSYSSHPPVLVDKDNRIVCYLTCAITAEPKMRELMKSIIEQFDEVADDPEQFFKEVVKDHHQYVRQLPQSIYIHDK